MPDILSIPPQQALTQAQQLASGAVTGLEQLDKLETVGKYNPDRLKGFMSFLISQLVSPQIGGLINNQTLLPEQLPFIGAVSGASTMLMDPAAGQNLQGFWSSVATSATGSFSGVSADVTSGSQGFQSLLAGMGQGQLDAGAINHASDQMNRFLTGQIPSGNPSEIRDSLEGICRSMGPTSRKLFDTYEAGGALKSLVFQTVPPLQTAASILPAAANSISSIGLIGGTHVSTSVGGNGFGTLLQDLQRINGAANATLFDPCHPNGIQTLSVLSASCQAIDLFYSQSGSGSVDWKDLGNQFASAVATDAMRDLAFRASGFPAINPNSVSDTCIGLIDQFMSIGLCQGGSDNLATEFGNGLSRTLLQGGSILSAVNSIYASPSGISDPANTAIAIMQNTGAVSSINSMLGGNLDQLFNLVGGDMGPIQSIAQSLREAAKKSGDPVVRQIVEDKIETAKRQQNVKWAMTINPFGLMGRFAAARKAKEAQDKQKKNLVEGKKPDTGSGSAT